MPVPQLQGMSTSTAAREAATLLKRLRPFNQFNHNSGWDFAENNGLYFAVHGRLEAVADRRVGERYIGSSGSISCFASVGCCQFALFRSGLACA